MNSRSLFAVTTVLFAATAQAQLVFHYDPDTGNVSFDTSHTRNGSIMGYGLSLEYPAVCNDTQSTRRWCHVNPTDIVFRPENLLHLSQSTIFEATDGKVSEFTFSDPWTGVFTLGEILPPNLDAATWSSLFAKSALKSATERNKDASGAHSYVDVIGGGRAPLAKFVYGPPKGKYQNRWDLVDPDSLNWAEQATLRYRQSTGELILDTSGELGGYSTIFQINSDDRFIPENFQSPFDSILNDAQLHSVLVAGDAIEPGEYNLGSLLPVDLTENEFISAISAARFVSRAGFGANLVALESDSEVLALSFEATSSVELCDHDGDSDCDLADIDLLYAALGNNSVDPASISDWLAAASSSDNLSKSDPSDVYTLGDLNLNGTVNGDDLGPLLNNFNDPHAGTWRQGNVNGAGGVDSTDLGLLLNRINAAKATAVPEPASPLLAFGLIMTACAFRRRLTAKKCQLPVTKALASGSPSEARHKLEAYATVSRTEA